MEADPDRHPLSAGLSDLPADEPRQSANKPVPGDSISPEDPAALLAAWQISPATHDSILHEQILPRELHPYLPSTTTSNTITSRPLAVFILGQTGAGKSHLAPRLLSALDASPPSPPHAPASPGTLHLVADTFKTYHPFYAACLAARPRLASRLARDDADRWLREVCAHAAARRVPAVVVETACPRRVPPPGSSESSAASNHSSSSGGGGGGGDGAQTPQPGDRVRLETSESTSTSSTIAEMLATFRGAGYTTRIVVLAVPAAISRLGALARYYHPHPRRAAPAPPEPGAPVLRPGRLPARLTPRGVHDDSFAGVAQAVARVEAETAGLEVDVRVPIPESESTSGSESTDHFNLGPGTGTGTGSGSGSGIEAGSSAESGAEAESSEPQSEEPEPKSDQHKGRERTIKGAKKRKNKGGGAETLKVDRIVVVRRNGELAYDSHARKVGRSRVCDGDGKDGQKAEGDGGGHGEGEGERRKKEGERDGRPGPTFPRDASGALEAERWDRKLTAAEQSAAEADIAILRRLGDPEVDAELDEIERMLARLGRRDRGDRGDSGDVSLPELAPFDAEEFVSRETRPA